MEIKENNRNRKNENFSPFVIKRENSQVLSFEFRDDYIKKNKNVIKKEKIRVCEMILLSDEKVKLLKSINIRYDKEVNIKSLKNRLISFLF